MEKIEILADKPAVRARPHDRAPGWRAAASGGADHRQAPDDFLGSDYRRHGGVTAQLSRAGKRRGDDDQGTTGKTKHSAQQANRVPAKNPGISFPVLIGSYRSAPPRTVCVTRITSMKRPAPIPSRRRRRRPSR
jgi:hypothetical protein